MYKYCDSGATTRKQSKVLFSRRENLSTCLCQLLLEFLSLQLTFLSLRNISGSIRLHVVVMNYNVLLSKIRIRPPIRIRFHNMERKKSGIRIRINPFRIRQAGYDAGEAYFRTSSTNQPYGQQSTSDQLNHDTMQLCGGGWGGREHSNWKELIAACWGIRTVFYFVLRIWATLYVYSKKSRSKKKT